MNLSDDNKDEIINRLNVSLQKIQRLELILRLKGQATEAATLKVKRAELSEQIDKLIGAAMLEWIGAADVITADVKKANASLQQSTRKIRKGIETAKEVVKTLGYVDDVLGVAGKLAADLAL